MSTFQNRARLLAFIVFAPIIIGLFGAVAISKLHDESNGPEVTEHNDLPNVIFSKDDAQRLYQHSGAFGFSPPFGTPTEQQVREAQERLPEFISQNMPEGRTPIADISGYMFQYIGTTKEGKGKIFINALCEVDESMAEKWHSEFIMVLGGGNCYFQITYGPKTHEFSEFWVNGEA